MLSLLALDKVRLLQPSLGASGRKRGLLAVNNLQVKPNLTTFLTEEDGKSAL